MGPPSSTHIHNQLPTHTSQYYFKSPLLPLKPPAPTISDERVKEVLAQRGRKYIPTCKPCRDSHIACDRKDPCTHCTKTFRTCIYEDRPHPPMKKRKASQLYPSILPKIIVRKIISRDTTSPCHQLILNAGQPFRKMHLIFELYNLLYGYRCMKPFNLRGSL